jgi:D-alanyl-D-alanine carboxypeptidase
VALLAAACSSTTESTGTIAVSTTLPPTVTTVPATTLPATTLPPATTTTLPPATTTMAPIDREGALQDLIDDWAADHDPVGVSAAVLYPDGFLWLGAAGLADREQGVPVVPADRFEIGSITKTFMSVITLRLAEEGVIALDDSIEAYLPEFPEAGQISFRHLLGHRAGVFDPTPQLVSDIDGPPDPHRIFTAAEIVDAAAAGSPTFPPGSQHDYSNAGYWVLAAALEEAAGESTGALLDEYVLEPIGLDETLLFDETLPAVEVVNAYKDLDLDGDEDPMGTTPLAGFITPAWTAGAMISTADELVRFLDAVFGGDLIGEESLDALLDESSGGGSYGLGIYRSGGAWGHDGGIAGFLSAAFHDPGTGVTVAALTNRFGPDAPQADSLAQRLLSLANDH